MPDTELPLSLGFVSLPAIALAFWREWPVGHPRRWALLTFGVAAGGAAGIGARGRPERVWFTLAIAAGGLVLALIARIVQRSADDRAHPVDGGA